MAGATIHSHPSSDAVHENCATGPQAARLRGWRDQGPTMTRGRPRRGRARPVTWEAGHDVGESVCPTQTHPSVRPVPPAKPIAGRFTNRSSPPGRVAPQAHAMTLPSTSTKPRPITPRVGRSAAGRFLVVVAARRLHRPDHPGAGHRDDGRDPQSAAETALHGAGDDAAPSQHGARRAGGIARCKHSTWVLTGIIGGAGRRGACTMPNPTPTSWQRRVSTCSCRIRRPACHTSARSH